MSPSSHVKFVADVMLGRLARLMRFHGYDVEYDAGAEDETLLRKSRSRLLLTKDRELASRTQSKRAYLVQNNGAQKQLAEIQKRFLQPGLTATRCLLCNTKLRSIRKKKVEHLVPPFVFQRYEQFYFCAACRRIYWQGTHFEQMLRMIK